MMYHAMSGLGDDSADDLTNLIGGPPSSALPTLTTVNLPGSAFIDPTTGLYTDYSGTTTTSGLPSPLTGSPSSFVSGSASSGFNWGGLLSSLIGTAGATTASVLNAGSTTSQVQAQSAAQIAAAQASAAQSSTLMTLGLIAVGGVVLVMMFSGGKR